MTYPWDPTEEDRKAIRRKATRNLAIFIGIKMGIAVALHYLGKKLDGDIELPYEDDYPDADDLEWFTNPYTLKISDNSVGGLLQVDFTSRES